MIMSIKRYHVQSSMNTFCVKLYNQIKENAKREDNVFFAPSSVYSVLSMVLIGATDRTADEIKEVFSLPEGDGFHAIFSKLWTGVIRANNASDFCELNIANRLWLNDSANIRETFTNQAEEFYRSDAKNVNFGDESSIDEINKWVGEKTKEKIKNVLEPGDVARDTILLITNAMYFYGEWVNAFSPCDTKPMSFYSPNGVDNVDMMYQNDNFGYHDSEEYDCKVVLLPYRNCSLKFIVILPNKVNGLWDLENRLISENFKGDDMWDLRILRYTQEVNLYLPKFKIFQKSELVQSLINIGLSRLFTLDADLTNISSNGNISVSKLSHAAFIDVNEKGTEAAAIMDCGIRAAGIPKPPVEFKADHPFMFMIVDKDTQATLFMGRICQPLCASASA